MSDSKPPKRKLRWFQFSLRTLLIFTLFVALGFGWLGQRIQRIRNEIGTTAELEKLGARIEFHPQKDWKDVLSIPDRWLWKWFGDAPVCSVIVGGTQITDTDLEHLKRLSSLQALVLMKTQVTDNGLEHLKGLTSLQVLSLEGTQVTDTGLEHIKGLTNLQYLDIRDTQVTDAGLEHLKGLTSLDTLFLAGTQSTDTGLEHLKGLNKLYSLALSGTQVTDTGVEKLQEALPKCIISYHSVMTVEVNDD